VKVKDGHLYFETEEPAKEEEKPTEPPKSEPCSAKPATQGEAEEATAVGS
jgi:hypothetical protein